MNELRTLIIGLEYDGRMHRALEVGPRLVKHLVAASADPAFAENKDTFEICCLARQIVRLGDIPKDAITGALLMEMHADDFDMLTEAAEKVRQRTRSFRRGDDADQKGDAGADAAGIPAG